MGDRRAQHRARALPPRRAAGRRDADPGDLLDGDARLGLLQGVSRLSRHPADHQRQRHRDAEPPPDRARLRLRHQYLDELSRIPHPSRQGEPRRNSAATYASSRPSTDHHLPRSRHRRHAARRARDAVGLSGVRQLRHQRDRRSAPANARRTNGLHFMRGSAVFRGARHRDQRARARRDDRQSGRDRVLSQRPASRSASICAISAASCRRARAAAAARFAAWTISSVAATA